MKFKTLILLIIFTVNSLSTQTTAIPDPNFEQTLINLGYDTGTLDGFVFTDSINTINDLSLSNKDINSLVGIEDFLALHMLYCDDNNIESLDLSQNTLLTYLDCSSNNIESLDLSQNTLLTYLDCSSNDLEYLDVFQNALLKKLVCSSNNLTVLDLSQNNLLTLLHCGSNNLTNIDVTQNTVLTSLACSFNGLTTLDVSQNTLLRFIQCANNNLPSLDITHNIELRYLHCWDNIFSYIDLSQNLLLTNLYCSYNNLSDLDLSLNAELKNLSCTDNQLLCLNIKNGNNSNMVNFDTQQNPYLECIEVDNVTWSTTNWLDIDINTTFSNNCNQSCIVGNKNIDIELLEFEIYPNPNSGNFTIHLNKVIPKLVLALMNELGQKVFEQEYHSIDRVNLNLEIPKGVYFLHCMLSSGDSKVVKIIKTE